MPRRDSLQVVDPATLSEDDERPEASVHGVVLAAGTSSRYGERNKLLESRDGSPLLSHVVQTLLVSELDGVTVVVGFEADRVREAVAEFDVTVRENEAFQEGQSTSVATGVTAAREQDADALLVALGDMPDVSTQTVDELIRAYRRGVGDAIAASWEKTRGNPVLFDSGYFDDLAAVDGDVGGREILLSDENAVAVETGDPGVVRDVDRPEDL